MFFKVDPVPVPRTVLRADYSILYLYVPATVEPWRSGLVLSTVRLQRFSGEISLIQIQLHYGPPVSWYPIQLDPHCAVYCTSYGYYSIYLRKSFYGPYDSLF